MVSSSRFLSFLSPNIILLLMIIITQLALAQPPFLAHECVYVRGNYTTNSTYHKNLNTLLTSLPSNNGNGYGFYDNAYARGSDDQVNAIGLCRGDVNAKDCRNCLNDSTHALPQICPNQKEAIGWYDNCMLRYANRSIDAEPNYLPGFAIPNKEDVSWSDVDKFNEELSTLLDSLKTEAAGNGSLRTFAFNRIAPTTVTVQTIYAIVQCTPDLTKVECIYCLDSAFVKFRDCCMTKKGGKVLYPSCNFRFEVYPFIDPATVSPLPSPPLPPPPSTNNIKSSGGSKSKTVISVVVPIVVSLVLVISIYICLRIRNTKKKLEICLGKDADEIKTVESLQFDFGTIKVATDNFSEANKLGEGGFGSVYRGRLSNGEYIAVKRLSIQSGQGDLEFQNEVLLVARLQHRNLVGLLGFCLEGSERLLIYEFVPNASLDHIIFDPAKRAQLDWDMCYKIIVGIVRGLIYLHEDSRLRIIHRDLKASNILIDAEMNSKISDFGMARLFALDQTQGNTSRIVGTFGYMAPEYVMHGHFSVKSDVYSFGVLILEIVSGHKSSWFLHEENGENLLSYAWKSWREGTASNLIDPQLRIGSRTKTMRCIHIGLLCVQENVADRPTMTSVALMLNNDSLTLPLPSQPAFFMHSSVGSATSLRWENNSQVTTELDRSKSNSEVSKHPK